MARALPYWLAGILLTGSCGGAWAEPPAGTDAKLSDTLKSIHNEGAKLFNAGDTAAAYYLFQGALQAVEPVLSGQPAVQRTIGDGLKRARTSHQCANGPGRLHEVIESVRQHIKPAAAGSSSKEPPLAPRRPAKPRLPVPAASVEPPATGTHKAEKKAVEKKH